MRDESEKDRLIGEADLVREVFDELPMSVVATVGPRHTFVAANAAYRATYPPIEQSGLAVTGSTQSPAQTAKSCSSSATACRQPR